jgi:hypothetical protein
LYTPLVDSHRSSGRQPWEDPTIRSHSQFLYMRSVTRGRARRLLGYLKRRPNHLLGLGCVAEDGRVQSRYYGGMETVAIDQIKGSEGRVEDFDDDFNPLHERNRSRWLKIAGLRLNGENLPPVELVHMEDAYFVRDGHHRISVAKALGEKFIDAEVIHWDQHRPSEAKRISVYALRSRMMGQQL